MRVSHFGLIFGCRDGDVQGMREGKKKRNVEIVFKITKMIHKYTTVSSIVTVLASCPGFRVQILAGKIYFPL